MPLSGLTPADRFVSLGWRTELLQQATAGNHLRLTWGSGDSQVLLLGHMDTVWPLGTLAEMPVRRAGEDLFGPGTHDMKAGLVQLVFALRALHALELTPALTPVVLVNTDEELGSLDSERVIKRLARGAERAFVLE